MINFALRNLKLFFRQKGAVFFSLMGVLIMIALYMLFLGDAWLSYNPTLPGVKEFLNPWMIAGILSVTPVTTALGALGVMVEDQNQKIQRDFFAAPVRRSQIVGGYILSACVVSFLLTMIAFALGEGYLVWQGGELLSFQAFLKAAGILVLSVLMSSSMMFFLVSFLSGTSSFAAASTVVGTLIGFLTGFYLPIGALPGGVQWAIRLFPVSHSGALLRQIFLEKPMAEHLSGAPEALVSGFKERMGIQYTYRGHVASPAVSVLVLAGTAAVFLTLGILKMYRKSKKG